MKKINIDTSAIEVLYNKLKNNEKIKSIPPIYKIGIGIGLLMFASIFMK